jgi:hypothetical protein
MVLCFVSIKENKKEKDKENKKEKDSSILKGNYVWADSIYAIQAKKTPGRIVRTSYTV